MNVNEDVRKKYEHVSNEHTHHWTTHQLFLQNSQCVVSSVKGVLRCPTLLKNMDKILVFGFTFGV